MVQGGSPGPLFFIYTNPIILFSELKKLDCIDFKNQFSLPLYFGALLNRRIWLVIGRIIKNTNLTFFAAIVIFLIASGNFFSQNHDLKSVEIRTGPDIAVPLLPIAFAFVVNILGRLKVLGKNVKEL